MTTASCKAKGRKLQQLICKALLELGKDYNLVADDIKSTSMGVSGQDVQLSPAARKIFDLYIESKNVEKLNVPGTFWEHYGKYDTKPGLKLLIHSRNRQSPLVTMRIEDFMTLLRKSIN